MPVSDIWMYVHDRLIDEGVPGHIAMLCAWMAEPLFDIEYPGIHPYDVIVNTNCNSLPELRPGSGYGYDIWVGAGVAAKHSSSAYKLHFSFDDGAKYLEWCNVAEWWEDDDRWRGTCLIYRNDEPETYPPMSYSQIRECIRSYFTQDSVAECA